MDTRRWWTGYACAIAGAAACTLAGLAMRPRFDLVNIAMVYLLPVVAVALLFRRGPAIAASLLSVLAFDIVFVPPRWTLVVEDAQYLLTFAMLLAVALVISGLKDSVRRQEAARAAAAAAAETERIRSTLLASISHDLRTPLAVLAGASSSLAEAGDRIGADERKALADSVYAQARDLSERVAKVLQMTRLESGAITLARDWTSLPEIAASVLERLREPLSAHRVMMELPADLPLVRVDAMLVEQALGNLLENAARHTPPGTVVRLRAQVRAQALVVSVEDYGPGLEDAEIERVFAKFHRLGGEASAGGVGLGLSIARAIVRLHGGEAWAERLDGGGTAFRFSLPLEAAPPVPPEAEVP